MRRAANFDVRRGGNRKRSERAVAVRAARQAIDSSRSCRRFSLQFLPRRPRSARMIRVYSYTDEKATMRMSLLII